MPKKHYTHLHNHLYLRIKRIDKYPKQFRFYFELALVIRHQGLDSLSKTLPLADISIGRNATLDCVQLWDRPDPCPPYPQHHNWNGGDEVEEAIDALYRLMMDTLYAHWRGKFEPWMPAGQAKEDPEIAQKIYAVMESWKQAIKQDPITEENFPFPLN